jgi:hypothetical protein
VAIKKTSAYGILSNRDASAGNSKIVDIPDAPTIGTATAVDATNATIVYTAATSGGTATTFTALSNPGSITGTGSSPITVTGLTAATAYTFTVKAANTSGDSAYSSASNSITTLASLLAYESIATVTPSGADVTFSSIPSTFKHLQIRGIGKTTRSDASVDSMYLRFNGDTGSNYNVHTFTGNSGSVQSSSYPGTTIWGTWAMTDAQSQGNTFTPFIIDIFDYSNVNKFKTTKSLSGTERGTSGEVGMYTGLWRNTSAINSIRIFAEGNYVAGSSFALYGIRG